MGLSPIQVLVERYLIKAAESTQMLAQAVDRSRFSAAGEITLAGCFFT